MPKYTINDFYFHEKAIDKEYFDSLKTYLNSQPAPPPEYLTKNDKERSYLIKGTQVFCVGNLFQMCCILGKLEHLKEIMPEKEAIPLDVLFNGIKLAVSHANDAIFDHLYPCVPADIKELIMVVISKNRHDKPKTMEETVKPSSSQEEKTMDSAQSKFFTKKNTLNEKVNDSPSNNKPKV